MPLGVGPASRRQEISGPAWSLLRAAAVPDSRTELIDWLIRSKIASLVSSLTFWRRVALGLGIASALLIAGLIFALLR